MLQNDQFAALKDRPRRFLLFRRFLSPKPANYENYGLWKSEKPPNRQYGGFSAVFVRFFNGFPMFSPFLPTKPANYENYG